MLWTGDLRVRGIHPFSIWAAGMYFHWFASIRGSKYTLLRPNYGSLCRQMALATTVMGAVAWLFYHSFFATAVVKEAKDKRNAQDN
eukprot:scaffold4803_cov148-Skeletonema_menzelii.AAC.5